MNKKVKIAQILFFSLAMHVSFAAESTLSLQLSMFGSFTACVASGFESAKNTIKNAFYDEEAFKKLGWPLSDSQARLELTETLDMYKRVSIQQNPNDRVNDIISIANRTSYLARAYRFIIASKSDEGKFARHCVDNHSPAMNEALKSLFMGYLSQKEAESVQAADSARKRLMKDSSSNQLSELSQHSMSGLRLSSSHNELFDKKILLKIGWGSTEAKEAAAKYLNKCLLAYKIKKIMKTLEGSASLQAAEGRKEAEISEDDIIALSFIRDLQRLREFIEKREHCIKKICIILNERGDGVELAAHCLKYHVYVMSDMLQDDFRLFIQAKQQRTSEIAQQLLSK